MKKKKKLPPLKDTETFKELLKDLRNQTPEQLKRLKVMLDEIIDEDIKKDLK